METLRPESEQKIFAELDPSFRVFMEAAPDAIVVVNRRGQMVLINALVEKMFGFTREEMLNANVEMLMPEQLRHLHVQHRTNYFRDPKTRSMGEDMNLTGRRKDGRVFPIEVSLSPLNVKNQDLVISIIRDTSPRQQLEAKFRGLLESAPDGIVVVGPDAKIVVVNSQLERMFGYSREELLGQTVEILVPEKYKSVHVQYRDGYIHNPTLRPMGAGRILTGRKKDGTELPIEVSLSPLETEQGRLIMSIIRDITDRRKSEELIQANLREKEALLKEIHHRVKNNLQVISSLLRLQKDYTQDPKTLEMFAESQNRIRSMALVHEKLYKSNDLSRINFAEYALSLAQLLFRSFGVNPERISLNMQGDLVFLSVDSAVPCGLIVNELVSNCIKHAFPNERKGQISILIKSMDDGTVQIEVKDNGIGLPTPFNFENTETLGLQLVRTLVRQLEGVIEVSSENGTQFKILFLEARGVVP